MPNYNRLKWKFFSYSRIVHTYVSTALFTILVFFSITGFTLNHTDLFGSETTSEQNFELPVEIAQAIAVPDNDNEEWQPHLRMLQQYLNQTHSLSNPRSIDMERDYEEITLDYPMPAGYAFLIVNAAHGSYLLEHQQGNIWSLMNDLHKGRNTGPMWSWVIDISAILILVFSITGLIILFQIKRSRRDLALIACVCGTITPIALYWLWVPIVTGV